MASTFKLGILAALAAPVLMASTASAKVYVNSVCHMKAAAAAGKVEGEGDMQKKFPLASISKVITTLWAIEKLGVDYRHKTVLHLTPTANGSMDLHVEGSRDPIFGRNLSYFLISELNRMKITKIENLTFDENFLLDWLAEESPRIGGVTPRYETIEQQAEAVIKNLKESFSTAINRPMYSKLREKATKAKVFMLEKPTLEVRNISFLPKVSYKKDKYTGSVVLQSAPLRTILKRMNNQSNNYIADNLYWNLGGTAAFNAFAAATLKADQNQIVFHNGSGNNEGTTAKPIYNEATCETMIKTLYTLNKSLEAKGYKLSDVLSVANKDNDSTVDNFGGNAAGAMIAKTGTVNKAKTLAGSISTKEGEFYFAILLHTDMDHSSSDRGVAAQMIKNKISQLINKRSGPKEIQYTEILALPFDQNSYLTEANAPVVTLSKK
ncbi:D-alanyl-D-alanine carboxypeptidase [Bdellovibrio bacteriovorus]|uniref:D-alanyl-D-alanine carboxypeptidase n=1 Tax=Bdellovibrio bacteriovorus TaxID=959 RepID=UPI003AA817CA